MDMQMDWNVKTVRPASPVPALLRGMLCSLVVLSLPPGAGVALIALASTSCWRLMAAARKRRRCEIVRFSELA